MLCMPPATTDCPNVPLPVSGKTTRPEWNGVHPACAVTKRQPAYQFSGQSGEGSDKALVCDGTTNCDNGHDEVDSRLSVSHQQVEWKATISAQILNQQYPTPPSHSFALAALLYDGWELNRWYSSFASLDLGLPANLLQGSIWWNTMDESPHQQRPSLPTKSL
ncbi:GL10934 [Drosophila persimilis]|uniref:GL10934 n=1 Tax=Drosophila persimilis TaxID=7234 RepID=B4GCP7_DROPE|nr:GL10934 [Drosophila persimilis]